MVLPRILPGIVLLCIAFGPRLATLPAQDAESGDQPIQITLDRIMSDPEWIGREPQAAYFADDGESIYYQQKRAGSVIEDWFEIDLQGNLLRVVQNEDLGRMDASRRSYSLDRKRYVYEQAGDIFVKDLESGRVKQLTRSVDREASPSFMSDGRRIMFVRDGKTFARHLKSGLEVQLLDLRADDDPAIARQEQREGFLPEQQQELFEVLRDRRGDEDLRRDTSKERQAADPTRPPLPWYLGKERDLGRVALSPNGRWCLVVLESKQASRGQNDQMPEFVAEDGYVNVRTVRPLVGTGKAASDKLLLLDLKNREEHELVFDSLPEFNTDPLASVKQDADAWRASQTDAPKESDNEGQPDSSNDEVEDSDEPTEPEETNIERALQVGSIVWNGSGNRVAVEVFSADNKDRWIATVNLKSKRLRSVMHRRDPAWINWNVGRIGWLADQQTLHFISEESGYAHIYVTHVPSQATRQLTSGEFVVRSVEASADGTYLYYKANASHPGIYEIYRVEVATGNIEPLTQLGGMNDYVLSPAEDALLVTHSEAMSPPDLWLVKIQSDAEPKRLTQTVSAEFQSMPWVAPKFVTVPSRAGRPIHARLYLPPGRTPQTNSPAVIFIHGAGYLQNAHQGWSGYFREFMFHSLLARRGYVVLDMDYRASAGYGRDWRTAIYRHMGGPEVEDLEDGLKWLAETQNVDADRVGLYGGSYGGFLTMMALFQKPGVFACGAALRPVTDWAHYNHGYTSNILNTPEVDPEAYQKSSPINLAEGLEDPLLICHGMVDDNVFFKDTVRLAQRLIELKKEDWEVAIYPVEAHGFVEPSSWYDEYRRIYKLFETHIAP